MGRSPCCSKVGLRRGPWSAKEDALLSHYILNHGEGQWRALPTKAGLLRCGKSCRLRWMNYLRPGIKRGNITQDEEDLILRLHALLGNRWSLIAGRLPGRTDNEVKNYWNTHLFKKVTKLKQHDPHEQQQQQQQQQSPTIADDDKVLYLPKPIRVSPTPTTSCSYGDSGTSSGDQMEADDFYLNWLSDDVDILDQVYDDYLHLL